MKFPTLVFLLVVMKDLNVLDGKKAFKKHLRPGHGFETRLKKQQNVENREKYAIQKREDGILRQEPALYSKKEFIETSAGVNNRKTSKRKGSKSQKDLIEGPEQGGPLGHLSELLGLKGSFIPSQSRQRWLEDEAESSQDRENGFNPGERTSHREVSANALSTDKGTLPLDISPQQAAMITSSAESNAQRRKFLQWEKQGGSMDTRHFPSTFIKGEDTEASKRVSTQRNKPESLSSDINLYRNEGGQEKQQVPNSQTSVPSAIENSGVLGAENPKAKQEVQNSQAAPQIYTDVANKDKKGFMGFMSNPMGLQDEIHGLNSELSTGHNFLGSVMHSPNEQPLSHEMINKLQLDPAWDAMEAKILAQHGRRVTPMQIPTSKIEKEMMPPEGVPVGQAYLPAGHHTHSALLEDFHKTAGFTSKPLRQDLHPSTYYSHFQPNEFGHTMNIGGALVHAVENPWKDLKQTTYDHADDNFPLASMSQQLPEASASQSLASSDGGKDADEVAETVGKPLTKVKGKKFAEKESSKAVEPKNEDDEKEVKIGKQNFRGRKPNLLAVKGKKFGKQQNDDEKDEDKGNKEEKEVKQNKQRKVRPSSNQREQNSVEEDDEQENKSDKMVKVKGKHFQQPRLQAAMQEDDDQGPRFSQQESNNPGLQHAKIGGKPQMSNGQQWRMEPGKHEEKFRDSKQSGDSTGRYIAHKFVNFLSDVAQHLNVDKLSIAEQLVKDVEESKKNGGKSSVNAVSDNKLLESLKGIAIKRRNVGKDDVKLNPIGDLEIRRKQPTVIKYIWNKGISVLKEE